MCCDTPKIQSYIRQILNQVSIYIFLIWAENFFLLLKGLQKALSDICQTKFLGSTWQELGQEGEIRGRLPKFSFFVWVLRNTYINISSVWTKPIFSCFLYLNPRCGMSLDTNNNKKYFRIPKGGNNNVMFCFFYLRETIFQFPELKGPLE